MKSTIHYILLTASLFTVNFLPVASQNVSPTPSQNHTVSYTFRQAFTPSQVPASVTIDQAVTTVTYYDGIGRAVQSVEAGGTYGKKDLVTPIEYDALGRADARQHLPYALASVGGAYQSGALTAQRSFYTNQFSADDANYAYNYNEYEKSPLQRVTAIRKPGSTYQNHPVRNTYWVYTSGDNLLRIRTNSSDGFYIDDPYPEKSLFKTAITNEDGLAVQLFSDYYGRTILERTTDGTTVMNTYYVYDESNSDHLRWVIPPEASKSLVAGSTYNLNDNLPKQFCYHYKYNGAGDVIEKRDPGTDPLYMHYNIAIGHKVVAKQTGSQRTKNEWFLYEYHPTGELYRMYRYKYNSGYGTPVQVDSWIAAGTLYATTYVQEGGVVALYEFDRYVSGSALTFQTVSGLSLTPDQTRVKGLKTYEKVDNTDSSTYAERRFYYDSKARLIQVVERNHLGYTSRYSFEYDFSGNTLTSHESHQVGASTTHTVLKRNTYDHRNRLLSSTTTLNGGTPAIVSYTYTGNRLTSLSGVTGSYTYDQSGNMLNDPRKNLSFTYNSLNLPDEVKTGSTVKAMYLYSYDGVKIKVQDAGGTNGYDYLGSLTLVKTSGTQTPETHFGDGIIRGTQVMYFEKDHLGSIRAVLNTSGTVLERNDYYPFGTRHANASHVVTANNRFKYNGKEDQTVGALGLLDYGARMYDAQIGRWLGVDPLADSYYSISPYVYCANNPVRFIDLNGMFFDDYFIREEEKRITLIKQSEKIDRIFDKDNPEGLEIEKGSFDLEAYLEQGYKVEKVVPVGMAMTDFVASNVVGGAVFSKIGGLVSKGISSLRAAQVAKSTEIATNVGTNTAKTAIATGQRHHLLSNKIMSSLNNHPSLKGAFNRENTKYIYNALDDAAHKGYQTWHRQYDEMIVKWLQSNPSATPVQFNQYLHNLHQQPWLKSRVPNVNLLD